MDVASISSWICGCRPACTSRWKFGGISMMKVNSPLFISVSVSCGSMAFGDWKNGACSASRMRKDSTDWSRSITATAACFTSVDIRDISYTGMVKI